jgi:zinc protease
MLILGGGRSSRLYRVLKEEKQLVYTISSSFYTTKETGIIYIVSIFEAANLEKIKAEIANQIDLIIKDGVTAEEINRAKVTVKTQWSFAHETPSEIAQNEGYWSLMGRPEVPQEYMKKLEKISAGDIKNFFKKYCLKENMTNTALIPSRGAK